MYKVDIGIVSATEVQQSTECQIITNCSMEIDVDSYLMWSKWMLNSAACHQKALNWPGLVETTPAILCDSSVTKTDRVYMEAVF